MTSHRSEGESENMKCNVSQTWLSWNAWLKKPPKTTTTNNNKNKNFAEMEFHRTHF